MTSNLARTSYFYARYDSKDCQWTYLSFGNDRTRYLSHCQYPCPTAPRLLLNHGAEPALLLLLLLATWAHLWATKLRNLCASEKGTDAAMPVETGGETRRGAGGRATVVVRAADAATATAEDMTAGAVGAEDTDHTRNYAAGNAVGDDVAGVVGAGGVRMAVEGAGRAV